MSGTNSLIPPTLSDKIKAATSTVTGQRRVVSVLALNIQYSNKVKSQEEDEKNYLLERELTRLFTNTISEFEGHTDQISNHNMIALFGGALMLENHAERAIRTALTLQKRLHSLLLISKGKYGGSFEFRMGINTGAIIIGAVGSDAPVGYTVIGDTVILATVIAQFAKIGTILASKATYQITNPIVNFRSGPPKTIRVKSESVPVYEPIEVRQKPGQIRGLTDMQAPMIGRDKVIRQLRELLEKVSQKAQAHFVLITGEAGLGKSRLLWEFKKSPTDSEFEGNIIFYEGYCQAHTRSQPYWMIKNLLRQMADIDKNEQPLIQLNRLTVYLDSLGLNRENVRTFLAYLLGLDRVIPEIQLNIQRYDAKILQKLIHNALRQVIIAVAHQATTILIFEDLHWSDVASWNFLTYLAQSTKNVPLLLILTSRESLTEHLDQLAGPLTKLELKALSDEESRMLTQRLIRSESKTGKSLEFQISERAAGNPFYIEEIIRLLIEAVGLVNEGGVWQTTEQAETLLCEVPGSLQALILARVDGLGRDIQQTLQKIAIIGASFSAHLLQALDDTQMK